MDNERKQYQGVWYEKKYDFTQAERGKFYNPEAIFDYPIYLEPDVNDYMSKLADKQNIDIQSIVNEWLRTRIHLFENV